MYHLMEYMCGTNFRLTFTNTSNMTRVKFEITVVRNVITAHDNDRKLDIARNNDFDKDGSFVSPKKMQSINERHQASNDKGALCLSILGKFIAKRDLNSAQRFWDTIGSEAAYNMKECATDGRKLSAKKKQSDDNEAEMNNKFNGDMIQMINDFKKSSQQGGELSLDE